ncbi:DUF2806 domain-containing protein [Agrobacterium rhizogenes]|uniref:DUF2806 domain-containing protein n=1 Tax=Rhizobium rhizogenes TaxID=359 RepID=UPI00080F8205|nr:DUF2806 domain-containing protein [Rhizobium rhizogenes]OCJ22110.1 hypothetical protein A6U89_33190 [Agrobacterium sp. B133/95]NTH13563.1 DUF2806 domain-containing protein [Rhizobium rhizogenes]NTI49940.1 DUF2806 domain-containing protein [Rhizobium rhizogenes]NTI95311.1 DUF2806 domain-containing protein [Rhizobium rhizogenes]NTJ57779.1 DUF2806 domain-containing protein [Rhizobium rhizogenes]
MSEDHLSNETSISAELTETGIKAAARSRAISAFDRLLGGVADMGNAWLEGVAIRRRAKNEGERLLIEATAKYGVEKLTSDEEFAKRALEGHFNKLARQQINKDAVVAKALEDLRQQPPSEDEANSGPEMISEDFSARFERYAEDATTDDLREKWARVLTAEIKRPNTFSVKVLRVVDELDASIAALFERVCQHQAGGVLIKATLGELAFGETARLVAAELLVEPGMGQIRIGSEITDNQGKNFWFWAFGAIAVALSKTENIPPSDPANLVLTSEQGKPAIPVYVLTEVGRAITAILSDRTFKTVQGLAIRLTEIAPQSEVRQYMQVAENSWNLIKIVPARQPAG